MVGRVRNITTWVSLVTLLVMLLMGSGVMVYCVGPNDHAAIEWAHGEQPCDDPVDGQGDLPRGERAVLVAAADCVDLALVDEAVSSVVSASPEVVIASPAALLYELPPLEVLRSFSLFSPGQDTPGHPDLPVVQAVILLI